MANVEKFLYTAGNPLKYEPVPPECAYTELDRENSRLIADRAILRGELNDTREALKRARLSASVAWIGCGVLVVTDLLVVGILLLK